MFNITVPVQPCNAEHDRKKNTIANLKFFYLGATVSLHFTSFILHWLSSCLKITMYSFFCVREFTWRRIKREHKNEGEGEVCKNDSLKLTVWEKRGRCGGVLINLFFKFFFSLGL